MTVGFRGCFRLRSPASSHFGKILPRQPGFVYTPIVLVKTHSAGEEPVMNPWSYPTLVTLGLLLVSMTGNSSAKRQFFLKNVS